MVEKVMALTSRMLWVVRSGHLRGHLRLRLLK